MLYLRVLGPKCPLSFGLCGHQFCRTSSCPAHPQPLPSKQAHWGGNPKPGEHPGGPPHLPATLGGSWLSNNAAWVAGSHVGLLLGLMGYSLPDTVPNPSNTASWPGLRFQPRLVWTAGLRPQLLEPQPRAGPAAKGSWGSGMGPRSHRSSLRLRAPLAPLTWDSHLPSPLPLQAPAPRAHGPSGPQPTTTEPSGHKGSLSWH